MENTFIDDSLLLADAILHRGSKRRERLKGYYLCGYCDNQYIFNIPKKVRTCECCGKPLHLVSVVDEFEVKRILLWSQGTVIVNAKNMQKGNA